MPSEVWYYSLFLTSVWQFWDCNSLNSHVKPENLETRPSRVRGKCQMPFLQMPLWWTSTPSSNVTNTQTRLLTLISKSSAWNPTLLSQLSVVAVVDSSIHPYISASIQSFSQCDGCMREASVIPPPPPLLVARRTVVTMFTHVCRPPQASVRGGRRGGPAALHPPAAPHLPQEAAAPHEDDVPHQPERGHAPPALGHRHSDTGESPNLTEPERDLSARTRKERSRVHC